MNLAAATLLFYLKTIEPPVKRNNVEIPNIIRNKSKINHINFLSSYAAIRKIKIRYGVY